MNLIPTGDIKTIFYDGKAQPFPVYAIPLESLTYNKYNGRIKSAVTSFESGRKRILDPKDPKDANIIEIFLYGSAEQRNEKTIKSLRDYGQQEVGIVTNDLIIIDGNRRASLLKKISREDDVSLFFKAIVLPDNLADKELEIIRLETNYQMGVDNKVEYKPIEKYLRCKELTEKFGISTKEVATLMSEKETRIIQWLEILKLMDEYLEYLTSPGVYTRLDKTEGHFVDLYGYLKKYQNDATLNLNELKTVYFDYIRLGLPVQRLRVLGNPNNNMSLFARREYWDDFYQRYLEVKRPYIEEGFPSLKEKNKDNSNEEIFLFLDRKFKEELEENLKENLVSGEIYIKSITEKNSVKKELLRIRKYLSNYKPTGEADPEILQILVDISVYANNIKESL